MNTIKRSMDKDIVGENFVQTPSKLEESFEDQLKKIQSPKTT